MGNKITILGEVFERHHIPKVSRMFGTNQSNTERQIQSIADAWHEGSISSAVVALESDLGPEDSINTDKYVQLPKELNLWFGRQVYLMRDLKNAVLIMSEDFYEDMRMKILTRTQAQMPDKPRMAEFLLADTINTNITDKGTLHLLGSLVLYIGDGTYKFKQTPRGILIKAKK